MKTILVTLALALSLTSYSQQKYTLSGYIKEKNSGEELIGATIYVTSLQTGTITNLYGFYSLSLPTGKYQVRYSSLGYGTITEEIELNADINKSIDLSTAEEMLVEINVKATRAEDNVDRVEMSMEKMSMKLVKLMPALMGEVDVIKALQYLPGVSCGGEGSSGIYVRGGSSGQNLILLDEAPVYNASHLMGFFSVFNPDVVKNMTIHKGGIPAQYGGRLSSLIDIRMNEGNNQKFQVGGGIGLLSSRLNVDVPVVKGKSSLTLAGRRTYADQFLKLHSDEQINSNILYFYDLNAKFNYILSENDRLFISGYFGRDKFSYRDKFVFNWGNLTQTVRWNHLFSPRVFSNVTLLYSNYTYQLEEPGVSGFTWNSNLTNISAKADFTFYANPSNTIKFGASVIGHKIEPGEVTPSGKAFFSKIEIYDNHALEGGAYISNEQKIGDKLTLQYGLRYSLFHQIGKGTTFLYNQPEQPTESEIIDSVIYKSLEPIQTYHGLEPRLAVNYKLTENSSVKFSYNRTRQYIHLVSNTNSPTPLDIWVPSSRYIKPQIADQVAVGFFKNFFGNGVETSLEVYYKDMRNQIDYKDGANIFLNKHIETEMLHGKAYSYGVELMVKKNVGKFTGWLSYTWSKTRKIIDGINNGQEYAASSDRPHDLSIVGSYQIDDRWTISSNWILSSGTPATFPVAKFEHEGASLPVYADRNSYRLPTYHRMDIGATYTPRANKSKRWKSSWSFSLFNVYARRNAYSVSFQPNSQNLTSTEAVRLSIIGTVVPAVTYNFKF